MPRQIVVDGRVAGFAPDDATDEELAQIAEELSVQAAAPTAPAERSAVSRFMAPIGQAVSALASLPGLAVEGAKMVGQGRYGEMVGAVGDAIVGPSVEQGREAGAAAGRGDYSEAALRALATVGDVGGAGADIGESVAENDIAGALGKVAVAAVPFARPGKYASGISAFLKRRAARRILAVMRPTKGRMAIAEKIAPEVVEGVAGRETAGGLGVGTRATLAERARARSMESGKAIEALQSLDTPVNPSQVSGRLRSEAASLETIPPAHLKSIERDTGLLAADGSPIIDVVEELVDGVPQTKNPALVAALRGHAQELDDLAAQYPDSMVPGGELFKQRAVVGKRIGGKAYEKLPGATTAPNLEADVSFKREVRNLVHDPKFGGEHGLGGSAILDNEHHVARNAYINLQNSHLGDLMGRGGSKVMNLLAGRLGGVILGGATGLASGYGATAGVAGATLGLALGESAYWGSLRATTYSRIARALRAGDIDGAAAIIQRTAAAYATEKAIKERERHRKAEKALRVQAGGVVEP
jgi:hypothetical protein